MGQETNTNSVLSGKLSCWTGSSLHRWFFPVEYGFVPQTWADDDDPLDIMILSYEPLEVGCRVKVRMIGALIVEDEKGEDAKILSVPVNDARFDGYRDISDVHPHPTGSGKFRSFLKHTRGLNRLNGRSSRNGKMSMTQE